GWDRVKLYFMMGLPTETIEDLDGIVRMGERALALGKRYKKRAKITLSVAGFVPKPHTPFQWEAQLSIEELRERGRYLKSAVGRLYGGKNSPLTLKYHEPEQTFLEGVFARGDRRLAPVLLAAWKKGARFDGWTETFSWPLWKEVFSEQGVDPAFYTSRERPLDELLPWDHIDAGVSRDFLARESTLAREGILSPDCRPIGSDEGSPCRFCGIIDCPVAEGKGRS
ncbi:MAG: B12-binding domain-containing radical SAM protein, partial [Synergistaceae bacterium]|nr:B12-binding domain-containing radical SAM protein [Synergistaceae bacterium]